MKRTYLLFTVMILTVMMLVGCSSKDMNKMKEDVSTAVSEAKDNLNQMIDNATVSDGDGHIGEDKRDETATPTDRREDMTEDDVTGEGIIDDNGALLGDATDGEEMTVAENFI